MLHWLNAFYHVIPETNSRLIKTYVEYVKELISLNIHSQEAI